MIECFLAFPPRKYSDDHSILIPHEVNNQFFSKAGRFLFPESGIKGSGDIGSVIIPTFEIDDYLAKLQVLEDNLDEIIKIIPLPETVGEWDGHYHPEYWTSDVYDDRVELNTGERGKPFNKIEFLKILKLIRRKALEAKEKDMNLVFSGD